ncbi:MAG: hypothetical protein EXR69_00810 [Myxococcales bacterium]|nr:hypothetical protein [Myxococcales bacterium]
MSRLSSRITRKVLFSASPVVLAVALGLLGPAALNDDEDDVRLEYSPTAAAGALPLADDAPLETGC